MYSARLRHDLEEEFVTVGALSPAGPRRCRGGVGPRPRRAGCEAPPRRARPGVVPGRGTGSSLGRREEGFARLQPARHTAPARPLNREIRAQELALLRDAQTANHL